ncbi:pyridoxamine 5'-phosphate oxidase family protein [Methylobacterium sp. J-088]|uniref:pyridoxamine 5'-phosphate oxidase family protein n=1 Tax=unclassified Methylobacterium TaxID=2615210 RepID=UPI001FBBAF50|nr:MULTISPECIES: pyridoxamine 5'-phosphate oxidase family protein [unclassified Methylobacterium]MCJ2061660.1 pyridoxamine 5'-phosphate oxidase family protein [Methylobacterium sp. J-088]
MTRPPLPAFYDDRDASFAELWRLLAEGAALGRSGFHLPALATLGPDGAPRLRTVVLREADPETGTLRFHCDRRSDKAAEIAVNPACALMAYDVAAKTQIRVEGHATLHTDDAVAEAAWTGSRAMSRVCYGAEPGPGTTLPAGDAYTMPDETAAATVGRPHFAAVLLRAERLEFLYLDRRGHRRAAWSRNESSWCGTWLAP